MGSGFPAAPDVTTWCRVSMYVGLLAIIRSFVFLARLTDFHLICTAAVVQTFRSHVRRRINYSSLIVTWQ